MSPPTLTYHDVARARDVTRPRPGARCAICAELRSAHLARRRTCAAAARARDAIAGARGAARSVQRRGARGERGAVDATRRRRRGCCSARREARRLAAPRARRVDSAWRAASDLARGLGLTGRLDLAPRLGRAAAPLGPRGAGRGKSTTFSSRGCSVAIVSTSRVNSASGSSTPLCRELAARSRRSNSSRLISETAFGFALLIITSFGSRVPTSQGSRNLETASLRAADFDGGPGVLSHLLWRAYPQDGQGGTPEPGPTAVASAILASVRLPLVSLTNRKCGESLPLFQCAWKSVANSWA